CLLITQQQKSDQKQNELTPRDGRMDILTTKSGSKKKQSPFITRIVDLSRRGDMVAITDSLSGYYKDKKEHPWHRVYAMIEKEVAASQLTEIVLLLRDAVFGALEILSLSLALECPTEDLISILAKQKTWKEGRKKVRSHCIQQASELIEKKDVYHLDPVALNRDGFGFIVPSLIQAKLEVFRRGRPETKKKQLDLKRLLRSIIGRKLLREHMIAEDSIPESDPRTNQLLEAFDLLLIELEIEESRLGEIIGPTEQVTLSGKPIDEDEEEEREPSHREKDTLGVQAPLTEFIDDKKSKESPKTRARKRAARQRAKKKGGKK
ncbi:MAG: hypothetical protein RTU30_15305, partial [Candidatus Thorarchaeota archaeon]